MECIFCLNENAYFDGVNYVCPDCGREWPCDEIADDDDDNNKLRCPECGSHLVYPDSSGINDYACDACGLRLTKVGARRCSFFYIYRRHSIHS